MVSDFPADALAETSLDDKMSFFTSEGLLVAAGDLVSCPLMMLPGRGTPLSVKEAESLLVSGGLSVTVGDLVSCPLMKLPGDLVSCPLLPGRETPLSVKDVREVYLLERHLIEPKRSDIRLVFLIFYIFPSFDANCPFWPKD
jgi:hypothetical protein